MGSVADVSFEPSAPPGWVEGSTAVVVLSFDAFGSVVTLPGIKRSGIAGSVELTSFPYLGSVVLLSIGGC